MARWRRRAAVRGDLRISVSLKARQRRDLELVCAEYDLTHQDAIRYLIRAAAKHLRAAGR